MTETDIAPAPLVYNGVPIHDRNEMLSLTDMWRAEGGDPARKPVEWLNSVDGRRFCETLAEIHNPLKTIKVVNSHFEEKQWVTTKRGGSNAGTWAHWQIAMAYAKYLSPEFHVWCNQVVRERMEGKPAPVGLPPEVLEMIRRDDGISRMLAHKVTGIEATIRDLTAAVAAIAAVVQPASPGIYVQGKTSGDIWKAHGLPRLKNGARWLGNRLSEMGCQIDGNRVVRIGSGGFRMFDPDKASACMRNGLLFKAKCYASERMGQRKLRLVPAPTPMPGDQEPAE